MAEPEPTYDLITMDGRRPEYADVTPHHRHL